MAHFPPGTGAHTAEPPVAPNPANAADTANAANAAKKESLLGRAASAFKRDKVELTPTEMHEFYSQQGVKTTFNDKGVPRISVPKKLKANILARHPIAFTIAGLGVAATAGLGAGIVAGQDFETFKVRHAFSPVPGIATPGYSSGGSTSGYL